MIPTNATGRLKFRRLNRLAALSNPSRHLHVHLAVSYRTLRTPIALSSRTLCGVRGVRGLHLGSDSAMKLCSTRLGYLWLEAAGSGPQHAEGEPPDKQGVNSAGHDRFPKLESVPSVRFHHTAEGENERPERSVRGRVPASFLPCHGVEVFLNEFGSPFGCRVVLSGNQRQRGGLGILGGKGDNGDVDVLA
jgi:hypothetical protein